MEFFDNSQITVPINLEWDRVAMTVGDHIFNIFFNRGIKSVHIFFMMPQLHPFPTPLNSMVRPM